MGYYTDKPLKMHGRLGAMAQDYIPSRSKCEASQPSRVFQDNQDTQ